MNEGCEGGLPHFNSLFAENAHVVDDSCIPYKGSTKGLKCGQFFYCKDEARVLKTYDVGGGYGQTSEKAMMKEILRNGVLGSEFQAPPEFATYKSGILSSRGVTQLNKISRGGSKASSGPNSESLF